VEYQQSDPYAARPGQTVDTGPGPLLGSLGNVFAQPNLGAQLQVAQANRQAAAAKILGQMATNNGAYDPNLMGAYIANGGSIDELGKVARYTGYMTQGPTGQQGTNASYGLGQGSTTRDWQNRNLQNDITKTGADADIAAGHDLVPIVKPDGSVVSVPKITILAGSAGGQPVLTPENVKGAIDQHTLLPQRGDAAPSSASPGVATVGPITATSPDGSTAAAPRGAPTLGSIFAPSATAPVTSPAAGGYQPSALGGAPAASAGGTGSLGSIFAKLPPMSPNAGAMLAPAAVLGANNGGSISSGPFTPAYAGSGAPVNTQPTPNASVGGGGASIGAPAAAPVSAAPPNSVPGRIAAIAPEAAQFAGFGSPADKFQVKQTGTDALGNPIYGKFNSTTGDVAALGAPAAAPGPAPSDTDAMGGLHGADYLKTLPPQYQGLVMGIAEGHVLPPPATTRNGKPNPVLALVEQYDPSFDASNAQARYALRKDFESGQTSKDIVSINTDLGHLNDFATAAQTLGNGGIQPLNQLKNGFATTFDANGDRAKTLSNLKSLQNTLADEYIRYVTGGNGGEGDREKIAALFDPDRSSTSQMLTAVNTLAEAMSRKTDALQAKWQTGMQGDPYAILNPQSQAILGRLRGSASAPPITPAPGVTPPREQSATNAANGVQPPRVGEIRTASDGSRYVFKGGGNTAENWQPMPAGASQ
jgi:hypothetical protein